MIKKTALLIVCALCLTMAGCKKEAVSLIKVGLRDNPKTAKGTFKWVKTINRGQVVTIVEEQKDGNWFKVQLPDGETTGWVEKRYIHKGKKEIIEFTDKTKVLDQPDPDSRVVATMPTGTKALVLKKKNDWIQVSVDWRIKGWVKKGNLKQASDTESQEVYEIYISGVGKCSVEASSTLKESSGYTYTPKNLFDKNPGTTWQEGKQNEDGIGEWVEISFPEPASVSVSMINGFAKKDAKFAKYGAEGDLYQLNNRVKSMRVEYWDQEGAMSSRTINFEDDMRDYQDGGMYDNVSKIRFIIDGVYKGMKWNDTSLAEIKIEKY